MLIDWFTVLAQIINFFILIYLLKRFLYKPVLRAMEAREKKMADALNHARDAEQKAEERFRELEAEKQALLGSRERLMAETRAEVDQWREKMHGTARKEIETLRRTWMAHMTRDRQVFLDTLKKRMAEQIMRISEKALKDLAHQGLNRQVVHVFLEKAASEKDAFVRKGIDERVLVQSGYPLEDEQMRDIQTRLEAWLPGVSSIQFQIEPDLGMGIQMVAGDRKVAWHMADYLEDLEKDILMNLFSDRRKKP